MAVSVDSCCFLIVLMKWVPVLVVLCICCWSYFSYAYQFCYETVESTKTKMFYLIGYHLLLIMLLWVYIKCVLTKSSIIPKEFHAPSTEIRVRYGFEAQYKRLQAMARRLGLLTTGMDGGVRYCSKCSIIKPDRTHHCSTCEECVMKMDHHCPWINNCVGFANHKFFVLFLLYSLLLCLYMLGTLMPYAWKFSNEEYEYEPVKSFWILFFFIIIFIIVFFGFLAYNLYLLFKNLTTLETLRGTNFIGRGIEDNGFDIGCWKNFTQVFGKDVLLWFLPVYTTQGDGVHFPRRKLNCDKELSSIFVQN